MGAHPGNARKLQVMGHLVKCNPETELRGSKAMSALKSIDVGPHVIDPVSFGVSGDHVILAKDATRQPSEHQADLSSRTRTGNRVGRRKTPLDWLFHLRKQLTQRANVCLGPSHSIEHNC